MLVEKGMIGASTEEEMESAVAGDPEQMFESLAGLRLAESDLTRVDRAWPPAREISLRLGK